MKFGGTSMAGIERIRNVAERVRREAEAGNEVLVVVSAMVLKNSDPAYLLECLERVSRGGRWIDPELSDRTKELTETLGEREAPSLSPRERELISLVRKGLRNREIAEQLGVTEGTIKVYLHSVFEKLGVSSRTELAIRADEFLAGSFLRN